ncbi:MAG: hypothetical protein J0649_04360 [Methylococcales bacterium]|nr:hypothetical protein [Methylococcales bacterium]
MQPVFENILILAKTYPSPSSKYSETSCVAGINDQGLMRRLFPIPFRLLSENQQFKKWQWVRAKIAKSPTDHRPESYKLFIDDMECKEIIDTKNGWLSRREWLNKIPVCEDFKTLNADRIAQGKTLLLLRPKQIKLEIKPAKKDWTEEEIKKLIQAQTQCDLFSKEDHLKWMNILQKIPFDFYYRFSNERKHKIVDWEAVMLFMNCKKSHGDQWEMPFRQKLEKEFAGKDLMLLMGTVHRFPHQWLIVSLIYPPKPQPADIEKISLLL